MKLKPYITEIIEGKRKSPTAEKLLSLMSIAYRGVSAVRHFAFDHLIPANPLKVPVVSVGNIVAGGVGKTPVVHFLATILQEKAQVGILSRGYGRKSKKLCTVQTDTNPTDSGDEPLLLKRKLPEAHIVVGGDRIMTGLAAIDQGAEVLLLDDGMQHRRIHRNTEIVVMDASDLFGGNHHLPRGMLRDHPKRLARADLIILRGVETEEAFRFASDQLKRFTKSPVASMATEVVGAPPVSSKKVAVFSAIGNPSRFYATLKSLGCEIVLTEEKGDHDTFTENELKHLANRAESRGAKFLVCTEKDAIKLSGAQETTLPIVPIAIALIPQFGKEHLEQVIENILEVSQ